MIIAHKSNKVTKIIFKVALIVISVCALALIYLWCIIIVRHNVQDFGSYCSEMFERNPLCANSIIPYDMLDNKKFSDILASEYESATSVDEIVKLYKRINNISEQIHINDDEFFSTSCIKKPAANIVTIHEKQYYISHNVYFDVNLFTLKYKVIKWTISIDEVDVTEGE